MQKISCHLSKEHQRTSAIEDMIRGLGTQRPWFVYMIDLNRQHRTLVHRILLTMSTLCWTVPTGIPSCVQYSCCSHTVKSSRTNATSSPTHHSIRNSHPLPSGSTSPRSDCLFYLRGCTLPSTSAIEHPSAGSRSDDLDWECLDASGPGDPKDRRCWRRPSTSSNTRRTGPVGKTAPSSVLVVPDHRR